MIQIKEDLEFQKKNHRWEIIGQTAMFAFLVCVFSGVIGESGYILRAFLMYIFLMLVFRAVGRRTLSEITTFDFVVVLLVAEATQEALVGKDDPQTTIINAFVVITTLLVMDVVFGLLKTKLPFLDKVIEGKPLIIVENGKQLMDRMKDNKIDEEDVLESARCQGIERMEDIKYAVLEKSGTISIIPRNK